MSRKTNSLLTVGIEEAIKAIGLNGKRKMKGKQSVVKKRKVKSSELLVKAPAAFGRSFSSRPPNLNGKSTFKIVHREVVDTLITGSIAWDNQISTLINPGNPELFPWLSSIASSFEYYRFNRLVFRYVPLCSSSTVGSIQMAPDYNASNVSPQTELIFGAYHDYVDGNAWMENTCVIDTRALNQFVDWHFVSSNQDGINNSNPIFAAAQFFLYTVNFSGTVSAGKLFVEYEVELKTPSLPPSGTTIGGQTISTTGTPTAPLKGGVIDPSTSGVFFSGSNANGYSQFVVPNAGTYVVVCDLQGTGITNAGTWSSIGSGGFSTITYNGNSGNTGLSYAVKFTAKYPGDGIQIGGVTATTLTSASLTVAQCTPI